MYLPQIAVLLNWRKEVNVSGKYSIHLRITLNRTSRYYTIQVPEKVSYEQWLGQEDFWVKPSHQYAFEINTAIREKKAVIHELVKRSYTFKKSLTLDTIMSHLLQKGDRTSFYEFMDKYIKKPPQKLEPNTLKKYSTALTHLKKVQERTFLS